MSHEDNSLKKIGVSNIRDDITIIEKHEIIKDGRPYMSETFISSRGMTVTVNIPILTPEEQKERDKEIERRLIALYKSMVANGRGYIFDKEK